MACEGKTSDPQHATPPNQLEIDGLVTGWDPVAAGPRTMVYLGKSERTRHVVAGDTVDGAWIRVDQTEPVTNGAERITKLRFLRFEFQCARLQQRVVAVRVYSTLGQLQSNTVMDPVPPFRAPNESLQTTQLTRRLCPLLRAGAINKSAVGPELRPRSLRRAPSRRTSASLPAPV